MSDAIWENGDAVARASLDAIIIADDTGRVLDFNPAAEAMFGHTRAYALGRSIGDLIVPHHHRADHEAGMARYMAGEPARVLGRRLEMEALRADGTIFPVELSITEGDYAGRHFFAASLRDLSSRYQSEAERRATEAFLQALVDDQSEIVVRSDPEYNVIFSNTAAARIFGTTREELIGSRFRFGTPPEIQAKLLADIATQTPDDPIRKSTDSRVLPSGEVLWLEWSNRALFDDHGRLTGHLSVARDITEQKRAAEILEKTSRENELYRRMFEAMPDFVYAKDREGRFIAANAALAKVMGADSPEDLIGHTDGEWYPPELAKQYEADERAFYESGEESRILTQSIWKADGSEAWQTARKALFRDNDGNVIGLIGHGRDVTEQIRAEHALATSEARFAAFAENAPVAMFLKDTEGRYVVLNGDAVQVIGSPREQIMGKTAREVGTLRSAEATEAADRIVLETGKPLRTEGFLAAEGDPYHWAMILRFPIAAPDGKGMWIGGFAIDMTAQKAIESDLERSREALHQSEKLNAMGSLLAGVAHELNNPLAIVVAQATMLEEDAGSGPFAKRGEKIRRAAERCGRIVQTFLGLARRKPAERSRVSLNDMATAAVDLMAYPLRTAGITVTLDLAPDLAPVEGDPDMLGQVVLNLLVNAQQAMDGLPGPRQIRVSTRDVGFDVVLDVADSGQGVSADIRHRIFEPFFSTKPQGVGTGVGLSFCHSVVVAHQGRLELLPGDDTTSGLTGAVFRVSLPVAPAAEYPVEVAEEALTAMPAARALVVDDEAELAETLAEMLESAGYQTEVATSAAAAQTKVREGRFDVILSDIRMPGMDGPAFYAWLLAEWPDQAARVAFVTGDALGVSAAAFLARVNRPVLEKPFSRAGVLRVAAEARGGGI